MLSKTKTNLLTNEKTKELNQLKNILNGLDQKDSSNKQRIDQLRISISLQEESISKLQKL